MTAEAQVEGIRISWRERTVPLTPAAVVAGERSVSRALLRRVLEFDDAILASWSGFSTASGIVVLTVIGEDAPSLPWVDGVRYLGRDPDVPAALLVPTNLQPSVPGALLYRALRGRYPTLEEPIALWPAPHSPLTLLSVSAARPLDRALVEGWQ